MRCGCFEASAKWLQEGKEERLKNGGEEREEGVETTMEGGEHKEWSEEEEMRRGGVRSAE